MRLALAILACLLTIWAVRTFAAPAPWYLWESRIDQYRICLQYPPGEGWVKAGGPFSDAGCRLPYGKQPSR
ncbi:hypothetical protein GCM10011352_42150 [Marinobacterium zhoushanense]|uniref:YARHG domain-containing protein n=1 Tax=Marinobacterium zhoushanense TaxID=1679163 RepID=A0ABQ1KW22_9GAMM|nr:hypothetical protein GCM10011352_42150 [Marinobacterium zhoushanense]